MDISLLFLALILKPLQLFLFILLLLLLHELASKFRRALKLSGGHFVPQTYPFVGCLVAYHKNRRRLLDWYTELLGRSPTSTIIVWRVGAQRVVVTANPENVEYMLKTNFRNYPKGRPLTEVLGDFLGCGIFNADGELWRMQRKLAIHEFRRSSLQEHAMRTLRKEVQDDLLPTLETLAKTAKPVDLQNLLRRLAFSLICKVSLGIEPASSLDLTLPDSPLARAFDVASDICARRGAATLLLSWKIKRLLRIGSERKLKHAVRKIQAYIGQAIQTKIKRMESGTETCANESDLLSRLISAGYDHEIIRDMAISFVIAGRDTTSAAMTWLFWLLSRHSDIKKQLVREIEMVSGGNEEELVYGSLKELKFLKACLCESMRLYPPVAWDSKHAISDDLLPDGTPVKSGDRVTYFPYGMGRMEALWGKDRLEFKPSRWFLETTSEQGSLEKVSPFKFPIFQAGPRDCIGKEMAFTQMKYVVASILRRFDFKPVGHSWPIFVPLLTAHMAGGFPVLVCKKETR